MNGFEIIKKVLKYKSNIIQQGNRSKKHFPSSEILFDPINILCRKLSFLKL
jgi:hypothetical protein